MQATNLRIPRPSKPSITRRPARSRPAATELSVDTVVEYLAKLTPGQRAEVVARAERASSGTVPAAAPAPVVPDVVHAVAKVLLAPAPASATTTATTAAPCRQTLNSTDLEVLAEEEKKASTKRASSVPPPLPPRARVSLPVPVAAPPPSENDRATVPALALATADDTAPSLALADDALPALPLAPAPVLALAAALAPAPAPALAPAPAPAPAPSRASLPEATDILFEAMHELSFFETAIEGASFSLCTALRVVPCLGGIVHLFDADTREFVAVYAQGPRSERLLLSRRPDSDALLARAALKRAPLVVDYGAPGAPAVVERHAILGDPWSALVVPVTRGGRVLAVIELVDPLDGAPFGGVAESSLTYIAEKYGEFLAEKGIVLRSVVPPSSTEALAR